MDLTHEVEFSLATEMSFDEAMSFVADVPRSLQHADFLAELQVLTGEPPLVRAAIPVSAAMFGQRELPFSSELRRTAAGARLVPLAIEPDGPGWAEVAGEARVSDQGKTRRIDYGFVVTVHLRVPAADRWGTQALLSMIEFTADAVLRKVTQRLPDAIGRAVASQAVSTT